MKAKSDLTPRQQRILDFICDFQKAKGYPPTVREIGTAFRIHSTNGVFCHLVALERKGRIRRDPNAGRAIELLDKPKRGIPLLNLSDIRI